MVANVFVPPGGYKVRMADRRPDIAAAALRCHFPAAPTTPALGMAGSGRDGGQGRRGRGMTIKVGDKLPDATFKVRTSEGLSDVKTAMFSLVLMSIWMGSGYGMVIYLAGLQNISRSYYEAAQVDGASGWQQFVHITLPLLTPTIFFSLVTSTISAFQVFDIVYVMTKGGPLDSTRTMVYTIYDDGFHFFRMGGASATAWVLFAIILAITVVQLWGQQRWVHYD